jgi:CBS domain containing-hemolysin-like protein
MLLLGLGLCLLVLALTSAADAAFTAISRHRLALLRASRDSHRERALASLIDDPYRLKTTTIFLSIVAMITATWLTIAMEPGATPAMVALRLVGLLIAVLVLGEAVPKALAIRNPERTVALLSRPLVVATTLCRPVLALLNLLMRPLTGALSGGRTPTTPLVTTDELRHMVDLGEAEGLIEHEERAMIEGVIAFGETLVREIMVPRVDINALDVDTSLNEALDRITAWGHSRIPIYEETLDQIVGILYAKDLLPILRRPEPHPELRSLLRPAYFVPETRNVNMLLADLQQRRVHMALIVDEYGGTAGMITIEDLIEQIVGEIQDEYDHEEPALQVVSAHEAIVDARLPIDDVNDAIGSNLHSETADRIGGLVYERLGRIPRVGDELEFGAATLTVLSVKGIRAHKVRIRIARRALVDRQPAPVPLHTQGDLHGAT